MSESLTDAELAELEADNDARLARLTLKGVQVQGWELQHLLVMVEESMDDAAHRRYRERWALRARELLDKVEPAVARAVILGPPGGRQNGQVAR